jgi:hypothetical protein
MVDDLSLRAKRLLVSQNAKLIINENALCNASSTLNEVLTWCDNQEFKPGKWIKQHKAFCFDRAYIEQINLSLVGAGYASIFADFSHDDHKSAAQKSSNEKQGKLKPTHHLVLVAVVQTSLLDATAESYYQSNQLNMELDINELQLHRFDGLVVVENRDSFNDWWQYQANTQLTNPLVIYRGDKHDSTACKKLLKRWLSIQSTKPSIYFGDYDLAGLRIATSAGYSHLLLPEYNCFADSLIQQHYPAEQLKYLLGLERDCPSGWRALFNMMSNKHAGLRQQNMYQLPLCLYTRSNK